VAASLTSTECSSANASDFKRPTYYKSWRHNSFSKPRRDSIKETALNNLSSSYKNSVNKNKKTRLDWKIAHQLDEDDDCHSENSSDNLNL
jgi:hypothetical protein